MKSQPTKNRTVTSHKENNSVTPAVYSADWDCHATRLQDSGAALKKKANMTRNTSPPIPHLLCA